MRPPQPLEPSFRRLRLFGKRPVAFASRPLSERERRYSASEREAFACVFACKHWDIYLCGRPFTLRTDHQALLTLLNSPGSGHRPLRIHRWYARLRRYNFCVEFVPGSANKVADFLSRNAGPPVLLGSQADEDDDDWSVLAVDAFGQAIAPDQLKQASKSDAVLKQVSAYVTNGWPAAKQVPVELRPFYHLREELSPASDGSGCLWRGTRLVIPEALRGRILELAHEGHLGIVKTKQRCRDFVWWPGLDRHVEDMVHSCEPCAVSGKSVKPHAAPVAVRPWPSGPWQSLQIDLFGEIKDAPAQWRVTNMPKSLSCLIQFLI
eukprot:m.286809 g.286809  ORF g.286809 m.286809 type:complete len:321 (+) comp40699_c0_seq27:1227-2189(+)